MTDNDNEHRSIFSVMDGIMEQVNKTKTIFTILIALIIVPIAILTLAIVVFDLDAVDMYNEEDAEDTLFFDATFSVIIIIVIGFGIRQLIILNRWTKKYQQFKDKQYEMEEKTDEELEKD